MVDVARLIMDNLVYILIGVICAVALIIVYMVYKKQKLARGNKLIQDQGNMPDVELTKTLLPGQSGGTVSRGKLEDSLARKKGDKEKTEAGKRVGLRRRPVRRTARRRPVRRATRRRTARRRR